MKGYRKYFGTKLVWFLITLIFAFLLNFILPRLMPGDPVAVITQKVVQGMSSQVGIQKVYNEYAELFGTKKPLLEQFFLYVKNVFRGDFGTSFSQYPRPVADIIKTSILWTIALQFPAIIVGWLIGNSLGALAA
ncbi:MAG: ABC transporter permease, partial [Anaerolineaceae bacterium]|nr:ABC transporter permease [Anaerolineaceae bacterium]